MVPREEVKECDGFSLLIPKEVADKYQPDFAVVAAFEPRRNETGTIIYHGDRELRPGMLVAVKPYSGAWFTRQDFPWVPEGRMFKILGTVADWSENILAAVEI